MAETVQGLDRVDTTALFKALHTMALTGNCPECKDELVAPLKLLAPLSGVYDYPSRVKCATLPWHALMAALDGSKEASSE